MTFMSSMKKQRLREDKKLVPGVVKQAGLNHSLYCIGSCGAELVRWGPGNPF
jgi:predicted metal-binding membrane protein